MTSKDFDPNAPLVDEKGLEYENLADFLRGKPVECYRNQVMRDLAGWPESLRAPYIYTFYCTYNRDACPRAFSPDEARTLGDARGYPQGLERFAPKPSGAGGPQGDGQPGAGEAQAHLVHPAAEPPVHGRLGS